MNISRRIALAFVLMLPAGALRAADWIKVPGLNFTQRLGVTVENPADADAESAPVHVALADLARLLPDARPGRLAVVDPDMSRTPARDRANEYFVPSQVDDGAITFSLPLSAHEKKQLLIYTSPAPLNMPGFPAKTGWDNRFAYRSFENNLMGFRMETGPGANTTGMAIDLFGKTARGRGVRLQELYEAGHDNDHTLQYWGTDCLKLGSSPGVGGMYVAVGDQLGRPNCDTTIVECLHSGPVESALRVAGPVEAAGRKFHITRKLTLWADERGIDDVVTLKADDLSVVQIGLGMRNLPNEKWIERPTQGYVLNHGDNNQPNYKSVGFGAAIDPSQYVRTINLHDQANGGHVYVLKGVPKNGGLVSHHHLAAIWDGDGQINNPVDFEKYLQRWANLLNNPPKVELSDRAESRP